MDFDTFICDGQTHTESCTNYMFPAETNPDVIKAISAGAQAEVTSLRITNTSDVFSALDQHQI